MVSTIPYISLVPTASTNKLLQISASVASFNWPLWSLNTCRFSTPIHKNSLLHMLSPTSTVTSLLFLTFFFLFPASFSSNFNVYVISFVVILRLLGFLAVFVLFQIVLEIKHLQINK